MTGPTPATAPTKLYSGECSYCAALLVQRWFGWEFYTGLEHFDHDAWTFEEILRVTRPRLRNQDNDDEQIPMRYDPIPANIGPNTRAIYRPQELGAPEIDPMRPAIFAEDLDQGPLVRMAGGPDWGVYRGPDLLERAEQAPRRGQYAQAFIRGLQAHRAQQAAERAVEEVLDARVQVGPPV